MVFGAYGRLSLIIAIQPILSLHSVFAVETETTLTLPLSQRTRFPSHCCLIVMAPVAVIDAPMEGLIIFKLQNGWKGCIPTGIEGFFMGLQHEYRAVTFFQRQEHTSASQMLDEFFSTKEGKTFFEFMAKAKVAFTFATEQLDYFSMKLPDTMVFSVYQVLKHFVPLSSNLLEFASQFKLDQCRRPSMIIQLLISNTGNMKCRIKRVCFN